MNLAPLNNSVVFKKLFANPEVVTAFVYDLLGIEIAITGENIELEKKFHLPVGLIDFALDIFIEDPQRRIVIEIQKVSYDYHYDRFLH